LRFLDALIHLFCLYNTPCYISLDHGLRYGFYRSGRSTNIITADELWPRGEQVSDFSNPRVCGVCGGGGFRLLVSYGLNRPQYIHSTRRGVIAHSLSHFMSYLWSPKSVGGLVKFTPWGLALYWLWFCRRHLYAAL